MNTSLPIFSRPDVFSPPAGDLTSKIFSDDRGEIHRLIIGDRFYNLLLTKAGHYRSGDLHENTQFDKILSGCCDLTLHRDGQDITTHYEAGADIVIPPGIPHLFFFPEDCVMAEWWDGPFKAWYYKPYRDIIAANTKK